MKNRKYWISGAAIVALLLVIIGVHVHNVHQHEVNHILSGRIYRIYTVSQAENSFTKDYQKKQLVIFGKGSNKKKVVMTNNLELAKELNTNSEKFSSYQAKHGRLSYTATKDSFTISGYAKTNPNRWLVLDLSDAKVDKGNITGSAKWIVNLDEPSMGWNNHQLELRPVH